MYEILVIDNNSTDNTYKVVKSLQEEMLNLLYYKEENPGLSYARNRGILESKGEILTFIDDDTICERNFLKEILIALIVFCLFTIKEINNTNPVIAYV